MSMLVKGTDYVKVSTSLVRIVFTIPDTIKVLGLGDETSGLIKIIGRLDNLYHDFTLILFLFPLLLNLMLLYCKTRIKLAWSPDCI